MIPFYETMISKIMEINNGNIPEERNGRINKLLWHYLQSGLSTLMKAKIIDVIQNCMRDENYAGKVFTPEYYKNADAHIKKTIEGLTR